MESKNRLALNLHQFFGEVKEMFGKNSNGNVVKIKNIHDLKLSKIKASELNKVYIDEQGQEYKLKYDPVSKKVKIIKVVRGVLNGSYVKTQYDKISQDKIVGTHVKYKIAELGKEKLHEKFKEPVMTKPISPQPSAPTKPQLNVSETEPIKNFEDIFSIMEKTKERLKIAEKNIYDSNVLSERYSFDDKIILDDLSRAINSIIIGEFQTAKEHYEDLLKGYDDTRLKSKLYNEEIKKIIESKPQEYVMNFLRELETQNIFINAFTNIIKGYDDITYKVQTLPQEKFSARNFHERQKFEDAVFLIDICKKDAERILEFLQANYKKLLE